MLPLILLVTVGLLLVGPSWVGGRRAAPLVKKGRGLGVALLIGLAVFLLGTGRLWPALAIAGAALGWGVRLSLLMHVLRGLVRGRPATADIPASAPAGAMTRPQALAVLGLGPAATADEIVAAHRRLITTMHPDRGGSDYLAAQINLARDQLLPPGDRR